MRNQSTGATDGIVIAGGGLAAQRCAETLRRSGYGGAIKMVCAEPYRPYDRPPLSKAVLTGEHSDDGLSYRPAEWYGRQEIELLLGSAATALSAAERRIRISGGVTLRYDKLLISTGSSPRTLPALAGYENVSVLRTLDDSLALRDVLRSGPRLAVVGAGFIGQEVAATARKLGAAVTMIEAARCPLARILGPQLGDWFTRLHRAEGVDVFTDCTITGVSGNRDARALSLSNGSVVAVDHVVVGVGVAPDVAWLAGSGITDTGGIAVDQDGRTELADVFAAGDVAATFEPLIKCYVPGSHWEAAGRQGERAARTMLGLDPGPAPVTSFWTDQYGIRIQYLGNARLADDVAFDGEPGSRNFAATFTRAGRAVAALLVDRPRSLPAARKLIENGVHP